MALELKTSDRSVRRDVNEMNMKTVADVKDFSVDRKFQNEEIGWLQDNSEHIKNSWSEKSVHR